MKRKIDTKLITATAFLLALEIVFQLIGNYVQVGPICFNLALIPIAIGAILYGPFVGAFLGLVNGIVSCFAPSTLAVFMPVTIGGTICTCLVKGVLAGFISGLIYLPFKKSGNFVGHLLASIAVPIVNSAVFSVFVFVFFKSILTGYLGSEAFSKFDNIYQILFLGLIGWNFIFEFASTLILSPTVTRICEIQRKKRT